MQLPLVALNRRLFRFETRINALVRIIAYLEATYDSGIALTPEQVFIVERAVIQLQVEWDIFVRNFVLDCATGRYKNSLGRITSSLPDTIRSREMASHVLVAQYKRSKQEPDWFMPRDAILAAGLLKVSNVSIISAELGVSPWEISDLRYIRNFIAHRSKRSAVHLRNHGLLSSSGMIDPVYSMYAYGPSGARNYVVWAQFIKSIAARLVT